MVKTSVILEHIEITPGVCGGKPRIAGHRITVEDIVIWHEEMGLAPGEIVSRYPITLADVHAALAYYYDNIQDIKQQIADDEQLEAERRASIPSKLPHTEG